MKTNNTMTIMAPLDPTASAAANMVYLYEQLPELDSRHRDNPSSLRPHAAVPPYARTLILPLVRRSAVGRLLVFPACPAEEEAVSKSLRVMPICRRTIAVDVRYMYKQGEASIEFMVVHNIENL